ncbi:MAG: SH3 domain-containing protein [Rickettsiales bacterium]|nr:SH3 domain-containing protein [Rickettsiales bacterium]
MRVFALFLILALPCLPTLAANTSGLPVPRFVSLKSDETNVRTGPGTRYPIAWVYRRSGMPVEVVEEYDLWRKIRDVEGTTGWVHKSMLDGKRNAMIKGSEPRVIKLDPETDAKNVLKAEPLVSARLVECQVDWCRVQVSGRKGWIEKKYLWGVYEEEVFE